MIAQFPLRLAVCFALLTTVSIMLLGACGDSNGGSRPVPPPGEPAPRLIAAWFSDDTLDGTIGADYDLLTTTSADRASSWATVSTLNRNADTDTGGDRFVSLATDGTGHVVSVWSSDEDLAGVAGSDYDIFVATSADYGVSWSSPATLNANADTDFGGEGSPRVVTDGSGAWVAIWNSTDELGGTVGTDTDIMVATSSNNGASWSGVAALNSNATSDDGSDSTTTLATDKAGHWVAAWHSTEDLGGTAGTDFDIFVATSNDNGASWSAVATLNSHADSDSQNDTNPFIATDGEGTWITVWQSQADPGSAVGPDYEIYVATSSDNGATWSTATPLNTNADTDTGQDNNPALATDGSGNWIAVWHSNGDLGGTAGTDYDIFVATSSDNGSTWSAPSTLGSNADADSGTDYSALVTTDGAGNWYVAWYSNEDLGGTAGTDNDIFFAVSSDLGASWSAVTTLNSNADTDTGSDAAPVLVFK